MGEPVLAEHVGGVENVLGTDGDALQGTGAGTARGVSDLIRVKIGERAGCRFLRCNPIQIEFRKFLGTQLGVMDQTDGLDCGWIARVH